MAKTFFPALYNKLEKKKQAARVIPLAIADINSLLSMRFNNKPLFPSIEQFYSEEYLAAIKNGADSTILEKIARFRRPSEAELSLLFADLHAREEKDQYSSGNQSEG